MTNTAAITHSDQFDPDPGSNSASVVARPQQADLALSKTVNDTTPNVGDTITFTVTLSNSGPDAATGAQVTDLLPSGLSFVSDTTSQGTYDSATGLWNVGTVDIATPQTLMIQATVTSPSPQTNTATITHADQFDPVTANNTASVVVTPQQAELALSKSVDDPTPNVGDTITYTVTLTNNGPDGASNVVVTDLLPAGVTFVSSNATQGSYDSASGVWTVGTLASADTGILDIRATVVGSAPQTNTATITHSDQYDPVTSNNTATATQTPQQADLALAKTVSNAAPNLHDPISYTMSLSNLGPDAATNVQVTDLLPNGVAFVSATTSQGTYDSLTGLWAVGTVTTTSPQTLVLDGTVNIPAEVINTATITHADQYDPDPTNNQATAL